MDCQAAGWHGPCLNCSAFLRGDPRLAHGQDRARRRPHHPLGDAAHEEVRDTRSAMRSHHDEIRAAILGRRRDSRSRAADEGFGRQRDLTNRARLLGELPFGIFPKALAQRCQIVGVGL